MTDIVFAVFGTYLAALCGLWTLAEFVPALWPVVFAVNRPVFPTIKLGFALVAFFG